MSRSLHSGQSAICREASPAGSMQISASSARLDDRMTRELEEFRFTDCDAAHDVAVAAPSLSGCRMGNSLKRRR